MSHDPNQPPEQPGEKKPTPGPKPFSEEITAYDLPAFDLAGMSDSDLPAVPRAEPGEDSTFQFDLPDLGDAGHGERTVGVPLADLSDLLGTPGDLPAAGPPTDRLPPLHVEEVTPVAEEAPVSELLPIEEPEAASGILTPAESAEAAVELGEVVPPVEPGSAVDFFGGKAPADPGSDIDFFGGSVPPVQPVSDSNVFDLVPPAAGGSSQFLGLQPPPPAAATPSASNLFGDIPAAPASSDSLFGDVPTAEPVSSIHAGPVPAAEPASSIESAVIPTAEPVSSEDSGVANLEPVAPVEPASGWIDSDPGEQPVPPEVSAAGPATPADAIEAALTIPPPAVEGSDIFAGSFPAPAGPLSELSDVIAATAHGPFVPATPIQPPIPAPAASADRPSDVALNFNQPPGGSTIQDAAASADLPVADEVPEAEPVDAAPDSLFGGEDELDSARLAGTPNLPDDQFLDLGSNHPSAPDASSILAEFSDPDTHLPEDSSAIRLEDPGVDATLAGSSFRRKENDDPTEPDVELPPADAGGGGVLRKTPLSGPNLGPPKAADKPGGKAGDRAAGGSHLFASLGSSPEFELLPTPGGSDPFLDLGAPERSLGSAASSIFSGNPPPDLPDISSGGSGGAAPPADPVGESADAVEFTDHPDLRAADSDSFHIGPDGQVTFEEVADAGPEMTTRAPIPEDEDEPAAGTLARGSRGSLSDLNLEEPSEEARAVPVTNPAGPMAGQSGDPSVVVDWVADSGEKEPLPPPKKARGKSRPVLEPEARDRDETVPSRARPAAERSGGGGRGLAGLALGVLLGAGGASAVYFSGLLPQKDAGKPNATNPGIAQSSTPPNTTNPPPAAVTVADAHAALAAGNPAQAVKVIETTGAKTPEEKAALGQARFFARLRELAQTNAPAAADDAAIKQARDDLEAVVNDADAAKTPEGERAAVKAALHLGLTYELAGDRAKAKEVYTSGMTKHPKSAGLFQAALDRLAATTEAEKTSLRLAPAEAERLAVAAVVLLALDNPVPEAEKEAPAAAEEPPEAGGLFWKAVNSAAAKKYDDAVKLIAEAKAAHQKRAKALAGRGLNPLTDPLEQIFPKCCDELRAYWELRKQLYGHPAVGALVAKEGVDKALSQLADAEKRAMALAKTAADLKTANAALAADLETAGEKVITIEKTLKAEQEKVVKIAKDLRAANEKVVSTEKDLKAAKDTYTKAELAAKKEIGTLKDQVESAQAAGEKVRGTLGTVAKELQAGKLLPEKFDDAALVAATRSAVSRATGPNLTKLVPSDLTAVVGAAITTGNLLDLAARVNKSEASAKALADDLARLKADHAAELKKLTDAHAAETKKLADAHAAALKKAGDATTAATDKLKADYAKQVKDLMAKQAAELKKAEEAVAAELKKAADAHALKVKELEQLVAAERAISAGAEKRFQADLANAVSPVAALDLWLPVLTELRRPADAAPALEAANKVLKTAPPGTEDAAKAQTVAGLALLLKGDAAGAKEMLSAARQSRAYAAAKGKAWAAAADVGFASLTDAAAAARLPVPDGPRKDLLAAARALDAGVAAYKAGRYAAAEKALADAVLADPTDPVAWYFLGAARWDAGKTDQAKADFRQGAEREQARLVPTRTVDAAVSPIQGPARDALTAARP
jgi:hypothetical protein